MPDMTAAALVADQGCSASCLLAAGREHLVCSCACKGRFHGTLGATPVPGSADCRQPLPAPQPGPHLLDLLPA